MHGSLDGQPTLAASPASAHTHAKSAACILVVDDEPANVAVLTRILQRDGYTDIVGMTSPRAAIESVRVRRPDLVLLDQHMPDLDGIELIGLLRPLLMDEAFLPIVFLSGDNSFELRRRALGAGATDFITKPFDPIEVVLRIGNLLELRRLHLLQQQQNVMLEQRVRERTAQLEASQRELLERLCRVAAYRDDATGAHTHRVGRATAAVARALGCAADEADLMGAAAELHDLGKVGVPDDILHKPGRLTDGEMEVMRKHTHIGATSLAGSTAPLLQLAEQIARWHHERWDGAGYPDGLSGDAIPLAARIVSVADVADALSHDRPYRKAWPAERVMEELKSQAGSQFDASVVDAYISLYTTARADETVDVTTDGRRGW